MARPDRPSRKRPSPPDIVVEWEPEPELDIEVIALPDEEPELDVEVLAPPPWPAEVPKLYPDLSPKELSEFLTEDLFQKILGIPRLMVLPFGSANRSVREQLVGMGLSRLLIRDLMLVRNLSIRGPEDTPSDFPKDPLRPSSGDSSDIQITGEVEMVDFQEFAARLWIHRQDQSPVEIIVPAGDVSSLIEVSRRELVQALDGEIHPQVEESWRTGRPGSFELLQDFGQLCCLGKDEPMQSEQALALWKSHPEFVLPLHLVSEGPDYHLRGLEYDPHDAQLCFLLFIAFWESRGHQPEAVQFLRKAISLSPGHGKAHMCAPHAAHPQVDMLGHSELGYRLLPGNPFAINNYILYLEKAGKTDDLKRLAKEGLKTDPYDHSSYERLIELYSAEGEYEKALHFAERLLELYGPPIHPRTLTCLQQNPQRAASLAEGWQPADDIQRDIRRLRQMIRGGSQSMIGLTPAAARELRYSLRREHLPEHTRIRLTAIQTRHGQIRYRLDFDEDFDTELDLETESLGLRLVVEQAQVPFLLGTLIDYQGPPQTGDFLFENPNEE
ncbi:MAG: hypothetical protein KDA84_15260 [Planctomycetaceae bacterium]|nr:hypothetical protein [Planctomycetaceae bacterium]